MKRLKSIVGAARRAALHRAILNGRTGDVDPHGDIVDELAAIAGLAAYRARLS